MNKKILITGSNGLLGQKLVELLLPMPGVELIAMARGQNRLSQLFPALHFVELDTTDQAAVEDVLSLHRPDHVIHGAAMTNVDLCETERDTCWNSNVEAVRHLIEACAQHDIHLVHVSTDFVFDGAAGPYTEEAATAPVNYYGETKLAAEELLRASQIRWAIARTALVYGTLHDATRSNIVLWVKQSLEEGKPLKLVDDQLRTPTLAEDLAMGCYLLAKHSAQGIYNISGKDLLTPYEMGQKVAAAFSLDASLLTRSDSTMFKQPARRPARTGFLLDKARKDLGYDPHSFEEGIRIVTEQVGVRG